MTVYEFSAKRNDGREESLSAYRGKVLLIVNTASKCGLTPQYEGLEKLYAAYKDKGFEILAFPCNQFGGQEPGTDEEIRDFCTTNYQVSFPLFSKVEVNGEVAHPLFRYLREQAPVDANFDPEGRLYNILKERFPENLEGDNLRWNFTKFLVDREGRVVTRFAPPTLPEEIAPEIEKLL